MADYSPHFLEESNIYVAIHHANIQKYIETTTSFTFILFPRNFNHVFSSPISILSKIPFEGAYWRNGLSREADINFVWVSL